MSKHMIAAVPELVKENIISSDTGERILAYYNEKNRGTTNHLTLILAIIGTLLVGSGILLLVAHNWDDFSTRVKTVLSFLPLILGQALVVTALVKYPNNKSWTEGSGSFLFFAVGASISLISQVYQVSGSLGGFLLTWVCLTLPLVYILSSSIVAMFCVAAITWYACETGYFQRPDEIPYAYVLVLALLAPHYVRLAKTKPGSNWLTLLNWFLAISLVTVLGAFIKGAGSLFFNACILYSLLFCMYYLKGRQDDFSGKRLFANPFLVVGILGLLFILLTWSFEHFWKDYGDESSAPFALTDPIPYLFFVGLAGLGYFLFHLYKTQRTVLREPAGYTVFVFALLVTALQSAPGIGIFLINVWILVIGLFYIRKGARENHFGYLNFGLTIIAALALCRFFDDDIPFYWRGLFFVGAGAGFFAANFLMIRRRKQTLNNALHA